MLLPALAKYLNTLSMSTPLVSIIIPALDQLKYTRGCIDAILKNTPAIFEIIVIDNGSQDDTPIYLESMAKQLSTLRYIRNEVNLGYSPANNQGAEIARGEYLVLLNNDTEPQPNWLEILLGTAKKHNVGITAPKLLYPDTRTTQHVGYVYNLENRIYYPVYQNLAENDFRVCRERELQAVLGACMLIPRKIYLDVGGLENYALEDIDLCLKVRERGYRVMVSLKSVVLHHTSVTLFNTASERLIHTKLEGFHARWPLDKRKGDDDIILRQDGYLFESLDPKASTLRFQDEHDKAYTLLDQARAQTEPKKLISTLEAALAIYPGCRETIIELTGALLDENLYERAADAIEAYLNICSDDYSFFKLVAPALKAANRLDFMRMYCADTLVAADSTNPEKIFAQELLQQLNA